MIVRSFEGVPEPAAVAGRLHSIQAIGFESDGTLAFNIFVNLAEFKCRLICEPSKAGLLL